MGHLEDINPQVGQFGLPHNLDVTGKEHCPVRPEHNKDNRLVVERVESAAGPNHPDIDGTEAVAAARLRPFDRYSELFRQLQESVRSRCGVRRTSLPYPADPDPAREGFEAACVIGIAMGHHDKVEVPDPELPQTFEKKRLVATTVDEGKSPASS
jgi:hypothetical protein